MCTKPRKNQETKNFTDLNSSSVEPNPALETQAAKQGSSNRAMNPNVQIETPSKGNTVLQRQ